MIMEYVSGGELFDYIVKNGKVQFCLSMNPLTLFLMYMFVFLAERRGSEKVLSADCFGSRLLSSSHDCSSRSQAREFAVGQLTECQDC